MARWYAIAQSDRIVGECDRPDKTQAEAFFRSQPYWSAIYFVRSQASWEIEKLERKIPPWRRVVEDDEEDGA